MEAGCVIRSISYAQIWYNKLTWTIDMLNNIAGISDFIESAISSKLWYNETDLSPDFSNLPMLLTSDSVEKAGCFLKDYQYD